MIQVVALLELHELGKVRQLLPRRLGGATDRSYRRQEGYVGVGAKLKRIRDQLAARGAAIDLPRPPVRRGEGH